jgi:16S rRNA (uracil1498-N3)-methyltransferase
MRIPRIYQDIPLTEGERITLDAQSTVHLTRVLRLKQGDSVIVFNGRGGQFAACIIELQKRRSILSLEKFDPTECESSLPVILLQGISRGDRMDFTIQKAVELGVKEIVPVITQRTMLNISSDRADKRRRHWQVIANSACEQCGRNNVPQVHEIVPLTEHLASTLDGLKLVLDHRASSQALVNSTKQVNLLVGPEGGFSEKELELLAQTGFIPTKFGPRVLRTETAALVALSILQYKYGDLG